MRVCVLSYKKGVQLISAAPHQGQTLQSLRRMQWGRGEGPDCCPSTGKANKAHPLRDIRGSIRERDTASQASLAPLLTE